MAVVEPNVFEEKIAYDPFTGSALSNAEADIYAQDDVDFTTPLPLTDLSGVPVLKLVSSDDGVFPPFKVDSVTEYPVVVAKSGPFTTVIRSLAGLKGDDGTGIVDITADANGLVTFTLSDASTIVRQFPIIVVGGGSGSSSWNTLTDKPSTFPPSDHTQPVTSLRNGTASLSAQIYAFLAANDAQAARAAIGAGTGNGTSNLTLGRTGTTAMPGNTVFSAGEITAPVVGSLTSTTVQGQLAELAASSGGSGSAGGQGVLVRDWVSGGYASLPASAPSGIYEVLFRGPVQPTNANVSGGIPAWIGTGSTQVKGAYEYWNI